MAILILINQRSYGLTYINIVLVFTVRLIITLFIEPYSSAIKAFFQLLLL